MLFKTYKRGIQGTWIKKHLAGGSFADVGGLWGATGEKITVANAAGASSLTMIDTMPMESDWWEKLYLRAEEKGLERDKIHSIVADLEKEDFCKRTAKYDFVHCAGVLYHVPNPLNVLKNLTSIANKYLSLSTQIIPDTIKNKEGKLVIPEGQSIFIPSLNAKQTAILRQYYDDQSYKVTHINRDGPDFYSKGKFNYGPSFWLPTLGMVTSMIEMFDFKVIQTAHLSDHGAAFFAIRNS